MSTKTTDTAASHTSSEGVRKKTVKNHVLALGKRFEFSEMERATNGGKKMITSTVFD